MRQRIVHAIAKLHGIAELYMGQVYNIHLSHIMGQRNCTWNRVHGTAELYAGQENSTWDIGTVHGTEEQHKGQQNCTWDSRTVLGTAELYKRQWNCTWDSDRTPNGTIEL